jgi:hypothetical protein
LKIKTIGLLAITFAFAASGTLAQDTESKPKPKAEVRTITGCLSKGDSADEFRLTGKDGSTWEVRSASVKLADHVGHTVSAHGVVSNAKMHNLKEDAKSAAADTGVKENDTEHGHLKVTSLKMVADSCR